MRLPQELIDHIIDYHHADLNLLRLCSQLNKACLATARRHLFAKISLKATSQNQPPNVLQDRCKRLHDLLVRCPEIIPSIRELEICEGSPWHHPYPDVQASTTWVTTERTLMALFRILTNVSRFDFSATASLYWSLLPPTFLSSLYSLLSLPSITYLRLHSWVFPNFSALDNLLSHSKNLKALALSSTSVSTDAITITTDTDTDTDDGGVLTTTTTDHHPPNLSLDVLTLDFLMFASLDYWLLRSHSFINIHNLRELRIAHFHDPLIVDNLLRAIGPSLEHFHLKPGMWNVYDFNLSHNPSLLSLRLTLENPEKAMPWTLSLLSSISPSTNDALHSIDLEFYSDPKKIKDFTALDSLLVQSGLKNLKQVEIGLFALPTCADFLNVQDEMSGLRDRGIVRCYRLGIRSQRSSRQLTPRISRYEAS